MTRLLVAVVAAGGVLLVDHETAQLAFLVGLCVLLLLWDRLPGMRKSEDEATESGFDWTLFVPLVLALVLARVTFGSDDDARLAALFVMAVVFSAVWRHLKIEERLRGRRPDGGRT